ncbi:MAG TPA: sulfatase [Candidatus Hydrogenedentes bacterium]|nr:sulfatase [Candidatus Hydrogenedentota bacterium]
MRTCSRRAALSRIAGGLFLPCLYCVNHCEATTRRGTSPSIVYVFSDEHRWQSMSFTEMSAVHTPHMARMAREGFQFSRAISNYPVCTPHRGMLITGRWPRETGLIDNGLPLSDQEITVGKVFRAAGWKTGYIGKWHLGGTRAEPFGFDHSLIWENTHSHMEGSVYYPADGQPVKPKGYNAAIMTDQALAFIEAASSGDTPYLLMLSLDPPHANFIDAPPEQLALYPPGSLPRRPNYRETGDGTAIYHQNGSPYYEGYHAHITAVDEQLGRILGAVAASPQANRTIVIYTSDHGSMFGSHGVGSKRQPYEESIRVPFLVWGPAQYVRPGETGALFGSIDVFPTLCGLAGLEIPGSCAGQDFSSWITTGCGPDPDSQFIMHVSKDNASGGTNHPAPLFRGIRHRRHTYFITADGREHLFDNQVDPYQENDLGHAPALEETRNQLKQGLRACLARARDHFEPLDNA